VYKKLMIMVFVNIFVVFNLQSSQPLTSLNDQLNSDSNSFEEKLAILNNDKSKLADESKEINLLIKEAKNDHFFLKELETKRIGLKDLAFLKKINDEIESLHLKLRSTIDSAESRSFALEKAVEELELREKSIKQKLDDFRTSAIVNK